MTGWRSMRRPPLPFGPAIARLRARLHPLLAHTADRWRSLTPRERGQVLLMIAVLCAALLWLVFTQPALRTLRHWQEETPRLRSQATALRRVLADVMPPHSVAEAPARPVVERLAASLDAGGLTGAYRIRPAGADWVVAFEQPVDAARLAAWLMNAPTTLDLTIRQATLQRAHSDTPTRQDGRVTATLTFSTPQQRSRNGT
ncbi:MAG: type II secretion system protein GspM [Rhodocyclaceae bacterium]